MDQPPRPAFGVGLCMHVGQGLGDLPAERRDDSNMHVRRRKRSQGSQVHAVDQLTYEERHAVVLALVDHRDQMGMGQGLADPRRGRETQLAHLPVASIHIEQPSNRARPWRVVRCDSVRKLDFSVGRRGEAAEQQVAPRLALQQDVLRLRRVRRIVADVEARRNEREAIDTTVEIRGLVVFDRVLGPRGLFDPRRVGQLVGRGPFDDIGRDGLAALRGDDRVQPVGFEVVRRFLQRAGLGRRVDRFLLLTHQHDRGAADVFAIADRVVQGDRWQLRLRAADEPLDDAAARFTHRHGQLAERQTRGCILRTTVLEGVGSDIDPYATRQRREARDLRPACRAWLRVVGHFDWVGSIARSRPERRLP